ncbi:TIGR01777 family oxidoreductase [Nesterenkonia sp. Act20]|uniref:TIGR01777 family oxidoreductase n=1 Tax=Nesterenkonia sp. Act20 TaxID=1483432 RepID=UPI001C48EA5B|nr:TIGR01777 family oxidoreductase [Nesterenkonia sp. Act20]
MPIFEYETHLPFHREDVFDWYSRPGALVRLHPPFAGRVLEEPSNGLQDGSESVLGMNLPSIFGTTLAGLADMAGSASSLPVRGYTKWRARHTDFVPGRGFADEMISGPAKSWRHDRSFEDDGTSMVLREKVTYELPLIDKLPAAVQKVAARQFEAELHRIFAFRERQSRDDLAFHQAHGRLASQQSLDSHHVPESAPVKVVAVSGASGLIGRQVCALLGGAGIEVRRMVRGSADSVHLQAGDIAWDPDAGTLDPESLRDVDAVIHLAGHPLASRFTEEHKKKVLDSRVDGTSLIATTLASLETEDPRSRVLISGSAIGYYGATPADRASRSTILTEDSPAGTDFLAEVCEKWEESTAPARNAGVRTAMVRTGIVQTPAGGALAQLLPLYTVGAGGPLGDKEWQSWISIDDIAALIVHLVLSPRAEGPVNGVGPEPVTAKQYSKTLASVMRRPSAIPVPAFGPKLVLGEQGAKEIVGADQQVSAVKAESLGYAFRHHTLKEALEHVLGS